MVIAFLSILLGSLLGIGLAALGVMFALRFISNPALELTSDEDVAAR